MKTVTRIGIAQTPDRIRVPGDLPTVREIFYTLVVVLNKISHLPENGLKKISEMFPRRNERI